MTPEDMESCWRDPDNHQIGIYYCPQDPRIVVPRRARWMGWTINFARRGAFPMLLFMLLLVLVPQDLVRNIGGGAVDRLVTAAISIAALCPIGAHLSWSARWNR